MLLNYYYAYKYEMCTIRVFALRSIRGRLRSEETKTRQRWRERKMSCDSASHKHYSMTMMTMKIVVAARRRAMIYSNVFVVSWRVGELHD